MDSYQEFLLSIRRDINCLLDGDRAVRRNAIVRFEKILLKEGSKTPPEFANRLFLEELHKPLFRLFADQGEKCRELSLMLTMRFVDSIPPEEIENLLPLMLAALLGRLRTLPFPEQSEELRLEALHLLRRLFDTCKERLNPFAADIVDGLAKALTDTCPDAKKECCELVKNISTYFDAERVSRAGTPLIASMITNLKHQHWKVRRATLDSLGTLLSLESPMMDHMEEVLPHLNAVSGDRTNAVRLCLSECLEKWLVKGLSFRAPLVTSFDDEGPVGFEKFEPRLLMLLLSLVADEDTDQVAPLALSGIERVAVFKHEVRRKKAQKQAEKDKAAKEAKGESTEGMDVSAIDVEVAPDFDYSVVHSLLPQPFLSGQAPGALTTTFLQLHLPVVMPQVLANLTQWTTDIRHNAARLLRVVLVFVNCQVAPFLDQVLVHLYKASSDDDQSVVQAVMQCAQMLGAFVQIDLLLGLIAKHLGLKAEGGVTGSKAQGTEDLWLEDRVGRTVTRSVQDVSAGVKNFVALSLENRRQVLAVLAHLLRSPVSGAPPRLQPTDVRTVIRFLEESITSDELLTRALGATQSLLQAGGQVCCTEWPRVFDLLLRMRSSEECSSDTVDDAMDVLAMLCERSRQDLYVEHLRTRLAELLQGAEVELWEERSPKRHILETLLRNAGDASAEHLGKLFCVLARQSSPEDASAPARIDILGLVHFLVTQDNPELTAALKVHSSALLEGVLIPNCIWKAGQSNNKIRKGGMVCIHALLERQLVAAETLNSVFADLLPVLKSCLDDSWSPDNRMIGCLVLTCMLKELQEVINGEQLREVYPELLKRLDDSNDKIRAVVCNALKMFFTCLPPNWSRSLFEYILRILFVHLDDPNTDIQHGIYEVLELAVHQDYATFMREAQTAAGKSTHPRLCEELTRLAQSLVQTSAGEVDGDQIMD